MIPNIERMDDRLDAVEAAMLADTALKLRVIKRSYLRHYSSHTEDEIKKGVLTLMSAGEGDYSQKLGMVARDGTHRMLIICHLKVSEPDSKKQPRAVEDMELDIIEEVKTFVRNTVNGMDLVIDSVQHSRQQEAPIGWFVMYLDAKPQANTIY